MKVPPVKRILTRKPLLPVIVTNPKTRMSPRRRPKSPSVALHQASPRGSRKNLALGISMARKMRERGPNGKGTKWNRRDAILTVFLSVMSSMTSLCVWPSTATTYPMRMSRSGITSQVLLIIFGIVPSGWTQERERNCDEWVLQLDSSEARDWRGIEYVISNVWVSYSDWLW